MLLKHYCRVLPVFCCVFLQAAVQARRLNPFVRHFEPLSYEPHRVHRDHVRFKRSLGQDQQQHQQQPGHVYLRFHGFDRLFHLKLRPDTSVFHKNLVVETTRFGRVKPDIGHIYSGQLIGEPSSRVFGALHEGVFEGSIQSRGDRFYVEAAHKFFARRTPFHSVLYAAGDVQMPGGPNGWCGVRGEAAHWMQQLAAAVKRPDPPRRASRTRGRNSRLERWIGRRPLAQEEEAEEDYYDGDVEEESDAGLNATGRDDRRRRSGRRRRTYRVCGLFIAIDHLLYAKFSERDNDAVRTRERLATLIAGHVARASEVYRRTNFGGIEDVSFNVHKIKINDTKSCSAGSNPFCQANMDPTLFLLTTAKSANFDEYCLAYTWTYRDFDDGVLGLAYVGNATANVLGVCDKNRLAPEDPKNPQRGLTRLSLNTGMITFVNYGKYVSQAASEITLCHEIGHNFGSPHDQPDTSPCVPGKKKGGNYIMYPQASHGTEPNSRDFSNCSIGNITDVIRPMVNGDSNRENCFEEESKPICGNELVEGRETCDCGYTESDCKEKCCYARHNAVGAEGCTLQPGKQCSPSAGPCCDKDCKLMPSTTVCHPATECREAALCISKNATCSPGKPKANLTTCNKGTQVCLSGECEGSVCLKYNMNECTLTGSEYNVDQLCLIACESKGACRPACQYPAMKSLCGVKMQPGAMCDGTRGYCDVFHKCRRSDEQGPLTRLEQALFGGRTIKSVGDYIWAHPFMSFFYLLIFAALMGLFFRCFSLHTPSNNPHKPHRKLRETLKNPKSFFLARP